MGPWFLTALAFWCACAIPGTVRSIFWFFPIVAGLLTAVRASALILFGPIDSTGNSILGSIVLRFHPYPFGYDSRFLFRSSMNLGLSLFILFVLMYGRRVFWPETQTRRSLFRSFVPLWLAAFLAVSLPQVPVAVVWSASKEMFSVVREVQTAMATQVNPADVDLSRPTQVTLGALSTRSQFSEKARRWLADSTITIVPRTFTRNQSIGGPLVPKTYYYYTTIQFRGGWKCTYYGDAKAFPSCSQPGEKNPMDKILDEEADR
jgi:hypothetical protein